MHLVDPDDELLGEAEKMLPTEGVKVTTYQATAELVFPACTASTDVILLVPATVGVASSIAAVY